jgi:hypothetical protein
MQAAFHVAREAYLRLASTVGPIPLTLLVSLIAVTGIAWAFTLYQPFAMSASMGSAMGEMEGMAMEDEAMDSMAAGWSFAGLLIFVTVWTIMMVAMMLPAAAPMILIFAAAARILACWKAASALRKLSPSLPSISPGEKPLAIAFAAGLAGSAKADDPTDFCNAYADEAVFNATLNLSLGCNLTGARWTTERAEHFNACMGWAADKRRVGAGALRRRCIDGFRRYRRGWGR